MRAQFQKRRDSKSPSTQPNEVDRQQGRRSESNKVFKDWKPVFNPLHNNDASIDKHSRQLSPAAKKYLKLKFEKGRLAQSQFLVEGVKSVSDIVQVSPGIIHEVLVSKSFDQKPFLNQLKSKHVRVETLEDWEIDTLADTQTNQGIVAVANFSTLKPNWATCRYVTLLDGVQDPGNVGAIFRTSLALGMDTLILGKGTCEAYNPKVVRASAGAFLRIPFEMGVDLKTKISFLRQKGFTILATSSRGPYLPDQVKLRKKVAIIIGNEGNGADPQHMAMADEVIRVPLQNKVESLNLAVAHGILSHTIIYGRK
jgi:TrmH family RNA methyltransferase